MTNPLQQSDSTTGFEESDFLPPLRPSLEARQIVVPTSNDQGEQVEQNAVLVLDPEGIAKDPRVLSPIEFVLATLFDGKKTVREVCNEFENRFDEHIPEQDVLALANELDLNLLLVSNKFDQKLKQLLQKYLSVKVRPAICAGRVYPAERKGLQTFIENFFQAPDSPSLPKKEKPSKHKLHGLIAPHIELKVGQATYAHAYKSLVEESDADLFVVLGVAHRVMGPQVFNVSAKDFSVPGGSVKTERSIAERLQQVVGADIALAEYTHRQEFSVEVTMVILEALLKERAKRDFEVIPILCGPVEPFIEEEKSPYSDYDFSRFVEALREELEKSKRKWTVISAVDFSHVGPKFQHSTPVDERVLWRVERRDRRIFETLEQMDGKAFFNEVAGTKNAHNYDGVLSVLTMLEACRGFVKKGNLVHFGRMLEASTDSAVTFAGMTFK